MSDRVLEDVWRRESSHVLGALLRRHADLGECEDAAQEALEAATVQWPRDGPPDSPRAWLIRVASRRLIDRVRADRARAAREETVARARPRGAATSSGPETTDADEPDGSAEDDSLKLILLCCHPALSRSSQVALTLRAVSGLTADQIAAGFLVPGRTMAQRLSRARATLRKVGPRFDLPGADELPERIAAVLDVLHLVFTEGHTRSSGDQLVDTGLTAEAVRLTRELHLRLPDHDEVSGALALMLLTGARQEARTDDAGELVPLAEQDRDRWDHALSTEGVRLLEQVLPRGHVGRFQLQAAIAAVHAESPSAGDTDWRQISILYGMLDQVAPSPAVTLNRAVATGMALGPASGLALVEEVLRVPAMRRQHRTYAVRAHLRELAGDRAGAARDYHRAAQLSASRPEQRYLLRCAERAAAPTRPRP